MGVFIHEKCLILIKARSLRIESNRGGLIRAFIDYSQHSQKEDKAFYNPVRTYVPSTSLSKDGSHHLIAAAAAATSSAGTCPALAAPRRSESRHSARADTPFRSRSVSGELRLAS